MVFEEERIYKMIDIATLRKLVELKEPDDVIMDYIANNFIADEKPVDSYTASYRIFVEKMNELFNKHYRVTPQMINKFKTRLTKFTFEEIMTSLENMSKLEFYQGKNDRGWIADPEFLLRNDENVDKFLNYKVQTKKPFEQPSKRMAVEIILYTRLATGSNADDVVSRYRAMIDWMERKNICPEFPKHGKTLTSWMIKDGIYSDDIIVQDNFNEYKFYLKECENKGLKPAPEIVALGEEIRRKLEL